MNEMKQPNTSHVLHQFCAWTRCSHGVWSCSTSYSPQSHPYLKQWVAYIPFQYNIPFLFSTFRYITGLDNNTLFRIMQWELLNKQLRVHKCKTGTVRHSYPCAGSTTMARGWVILPSMRVLRVWEAFSSLATLMVFSGPSSVQYRFWPIQSTAMPSTVWIPTGGRVCDKTRPFLNITCDRRSLSVTSTSQRTSRLSWMSSDIVQWYNYRSDPVQTTEKILPLFTMMSRSVPSIFCRPMVYVVASLK